MFSRLFRRFKEDQSRTGGAFVSAPAIEALESRQLLSATDLSLSVFSPSPSTLLVPRALAYDLLFDANRNQLLVQNSYGGDGISRYDAATGQLLGSIPIDLYGSDITPDGNALYGVVGTQCFRISLVD